MRRSGVRLFLLFVCSVSACAGAAGTLPARASQESPSIRQALLNAEYPVGFTSTGKARLKDGAFGESVAPGSKTRIWLDKERAYGDLNADGAEDAAVALVVDPGGSGTFTYLVPVINEKGVAKPLAGVLLGDRIKLKSIAIQSGLIVVTMLTRKPGEPMSVQPKVEVTRRLKLQGDKLVEAR